MARTDAQPDIPDEWRTAYTNAAWACEDRGQHRFGKCCNNAGLAAVRNTIARDNWIVPKVASDVNQSVRPIVHGRWISWDQGQSDSEHTRLYAAQLLAAADEAEAASAEDHIPA